MFTHERGIGIINFEIVFKEERNMGILREEMENKIIFQKLELLISEV